MPRLRFPGEGSFFGAMRRFIVSGEASSSPLAAPKNRGGSQQSLRCNSLAHEVIGNFRFGGLWFLVGFTVLLICGQGCGAKSDSATSASPSQKRDRNEISQSTKSQSAPAKLVDVDQQRYREATDAIKDGDLYRAEQILTQLAEKYPGNVSILSDAARTANRRGNRHLGNSHLRALSRVAPLTLKELYYMLAPTWDYPLIDAEKLDDSAPISATVLNRARKLRRAGEIREAIKVLDDYQTKSDDAAAAALLGRFWAESQQFDRAVSWLDGRTESWKSYPDFWVTTGWIAQTAGHNDLAVVAFSEALQREPYDQSALIQLSAALEAAGEKKGAEYYRDRWDVVKNLAELGGDIAASPKSQPFAYSVMERELTKLGQPIDAFHWILLKRQSNSSIRSRIKDKPIDRANAVAAYQSKEHVENRLPFITSANLPIDFSRLKDAIAKVGTVSSPDSDSHPDGIVSAKFKNVARELDLSFQYANAVPVKRRYFLLHEALGAGVACLDFDRDGQVDLYFAQGAGNPPEQLGAKPNALVRNLGLRFHDVTLESECDDRDYSMAVTSGDWNQDGFPDLVVGNMGENRLLINQGDGTFRLQSGDEAWRESMYTTSLAMADVTGDSIPDIVEVNYTNDEGIFEQIRFGPDGSPMRLPGPLQFQAASDRLFIGDGDSSLSGRVLTADSIRRYGLGTVVTDFDQDGENEIFVGNDQTPNQFWRRIQSGEHNASDDFIDVAVASGVSGGSGGLPTASMGISVADFDRDGSADIHVTNFRDEWSNHYLQKKPGWFIDQSLPWKIDRPTRDMLAFGAQAIDVDNDGKVDLVIGNGHLEDFSDREIPFKMPTQMFSGDGASFRQLEVKGDDEYWKSGHLSRAIAKLDFDGDGRMDFAVTDLLEPAALLRNETKTDHHFLQVEVVGTASERDAIGAKVTVVGEDWRQTSFVTSGDGYMCKNEFVSHFGLGSSTDIKSVEVVWPDGKSESWSDVEVDQRVIIVEGQSEMFVR